MKDLGLMHYFLGLEVWQSPERIFLNQGKYAVEILKRFHMLDCKPVNTPMEAKLKLLVDTILCKLRPSSWGHTGRRSNGRSEGETAATVTEEVVWSDLFIQIPDSDRHARSFAHG